MYFYVLMIAINATDINVENADHLSVHMTANSCAEAIIVAKNSTHLQEFPDAHLWCEEWNI